MTNTKTTKTLMSRETMDYTTKAMVYKVDTAVASIITIKVTMIVAMALKIILSKPIASHRQSMSGKVKLAANKLQST